MLFFVLADQNHIYTQTAFTWDVNDAGFVKLETPWVISQLCRIIHHVHSTPKKNNTLCFRVSTQYVGGLGPQISVLKRPSGSWVPIKSLMTCHVEKLKKSSFSHWLLCYWMTIQIETNESWILLIRNGWYCSYEVRIRSACYLSLTKIKGPRSRSSLEMCEITCYWWPGTLSLA